jgi:phosphoglycerol transferase MdoB-like AlkP superfamily enzyme
MNPSSQTRLQLFLSRPEGRVIGMGLIALSCFSVARLALWINFFEDFKVLSPWQTLEAFVIGLRFDLSIATVFLFVPFLMLLLSPSASGVLARVWQQCWSWLVYLILMSLVLMMIADHLYFEDTHRHVASEIKAISEDWASMASLAWRQYLSVTSLFLGAVVLSFLGWRNWTQSDLVTCMTWRARSFLAFSFVALSVISIRGGVLYRPISVSDAFFSNQVTQGYLVLNGPFSIVRALMAPSLSPLSVMPEAQAELRVAKQFRTAFHPYEPPLSFVATGRPSQNARPNVVILLLESWGATQVDAMRQQMHLQPLQATPNFDRLAQSGRLFSNFYASGQRSIVGLSAIMTGLPVLPGMPAMGDGMEQFPINFLGNIAVSQGYQTLFIQSSERLSLKLNALSSRAGFQTYMGDEDIPELHSVKKPSGVWGTWDHNTFQEANKQFSQMKQPFLGLVFTSTTHGPWMTPDRRWDKFPKETDKGRAMNSLYYADWALGEFVAAAKKSPYYNNTIFILLADHASQFIDNRTDARNLFHIPFLMFGPGVKPGVDQRIGSQTDILPTVIDAVGWGGQYKSIGRSLLRPDTSGASALGVSDRMMTYITPKGWLSHDLSQRLGAGGLTPFDLHESELDLFALYQVATKTQLANTSKTK